MLLRICAILEAATGLAIVAVPAVVIRLLLGAETTGAALVVGRVLGFALVALAVACWYGRSSTRLALAGMLIYDLLVAVYFGYLGVQGDWVGPALWPAAAAHAVLSALLARSLLKAMAASAEPSSFTSTTTNRAQA